MRPHARAGAARVRELLDLQVLPVSVARFRLRAARVARRRGDRWALEAATGPGDLAVLLELARGARQVAELGSACGWTTISVALAESGSSVTSFDPVVHAHRDAYLSLVGPDVRERIAFVPSSGADGATSTAESVDLLFVDSTHEREATIAEFEAWRSLLAPGAAVAFHDYGHPDFPGVEQAVTQLALEGERRGGLFVWRAPA